MRNLFARKSPTPPTVICYADATFRQIASFAQLNVQVRVCGGALFSGCVSRTSHVYKCSLTDINACALTFYSYTHSPIR